MHYIIRNVYEGVLPVKVIQHNTQTENVLPVTIHATT